MPVYEKDGVTLTLNCERQSDSGLTVTLTASNSTDSDISSFTLQAAVPKVCPTTCDEKHSVHPVNKLTSRQALFVGIDFLHNSAACGRKKCFVFLHLSVLYDTQRFVATPTVSLHLTSPCCSHGVRFRPCRVLSGGHQCCKQHACVLVL